MLNDDKRQRITELVCGIGKGNVSDLKELIELIQHDLQKLAMSYLFDVYLAEEVVSDTFRTTGGQSGCPVYWHTSKYGYQSVAIHAYGGSSENSGTRITSSMFDFFSSFRD